MLPVVISIVSVLASSNPAQDDVELQINAKASLASLKQAIRLVRKIDKDPILSISQSPKPRIEGQLRRVDEPEEGFPDENSLVVTTGVINGPLNGGGRTHYLRRVHGKWHVIKSESWVS